MEKLCLQWQLQGCLKKLISQRSDGILVHSSTQSLNPEDFRGALVNLDLQPVWWWTGSVRTKPTHSLLSSMLRMVDLLEGQPMSYLHPGRWLKEFSGTFIHLRLCNLDSASNKRKKNTPHNDASSSEFHCNYSIFRVEMQILLLLIWCIVW